MVAESVLDILAPTGAWVAVPLTSESVCMVGGLSCALMVEAMIGEGVDCAGVLGTVAGVLVRAMPGVAAPIGGGALGVGLEFADGHPIPANHGHQPQGGKAPRACCDA